MPDPTAEQLLAEIARLDREAQERWRLAKLARRYAALVRAEIARDGVASPESLARLASVGARVGATLKEEAGSPYLPSRLRDSSIVVAMDANNATVPLVRSRMGRPLETDHPFPRRLEATGSDVDRWSKEHDLSPKKVRSWYQKSQPRRIPRIWAEIIEREMGVDEHGKPYVPATLATWPSGIR